MPKEAQGEEAQGEAAPGEEAHGEETQVKEAQGEEAQGEEIQGEGAPQEGNEAKEDSADQAASKASPANGEGEEILKPRRTSQRGGGYRKADNFRDWGLAWQAASGGPHRSEPNVAMKIAIKGIGGRRSRNGHQANQRRVELTEEDGRYDDHCRYDGSWSRKPGRWSWKRHHSRGKSVPQMNQQPSSSSSSSTAAAAGAAAGAAAAALQAIQEGLAEEGAPKKSRPSPRNNNPIEEVIESPFHTACEHLGVPEDATEAQSKKSI